MSLDSPILPSDFPDVKWAKLQRQFAGIGDATGIDFPNLHGTQGMQWVQVYKWASLVAVDAGATPGPALRASDSEGVKWMKLQRLFGDSSDALGSPGTFGNIRFSDTEGVKWAKLWQWAHWVGDHSGGGVIAAPVITSSLTASAVRDEAFSYTITATNTPTSFSASGLPAGLSVNTGTGAITGTPTAGGTFNVTIGATNAGGSDSETLVIAVGVITWINDAMPGAADTDGSSNPTSISFSNIALPAGESRGARIYTGDNTGTADVKLALYRADRTGPIAQGIKLAHAADNTYAEVTWGTPVVLTAANYFLSWEASTFELILRFQNGAGDWGANELAYADFPPSPLPADLYGGAFARAFAVGVSVVIVP